MLLNHLRHPRHNLIPPHRLSLIPRRMLLKTSRRPLVLLRSRPAIQAFFAMKVRTREARLVSIGWDGIPVA